jgi:hypothetical protein
VITIDRWSSLGIGINEKTCYLAFYPCPSNGESVRVTEAVSLGLPGDRWRKVLNLLAKSPDGRTASISDLVTELGYLKIGGIRISDEQAEFDEGIVQKAKRARDTLRGAMADLGRELRRLIATAVDAKVFQGSSDNYQAAFTVGFLMQDETRNNRFSWG